MKNTPLPSAPLPEEQYSWLEAKNKIRTGDIISFFTSHEENFFHRIASETIQFFTGSRIFHTGIAVWVTPEGTNDDRLMVFEAVGFGRRLVNIERFSGRKMEIHHLPEQYKAKDVVNYLWNGFGTPYGFWNLAAIAIREFFGLTPKSQPKAQVCSEVAAKAWEYAGFPFETTSLSPGRLRNYLASKGAPPSMMINPKAGK